MLKFKKCFLTISNQIKIITTPIFYVNAQPHIGHLYTAILADAIKENNIIQGNKVYLSTGTDEHGLKVQQKAKENKIDVKLFCDKNSQKFKELFDKANIKYDDYIRTTEDRHIDEVHKFWNKMNSKISKSRIIIIKASILAIIVYQMKVSYQKKILLKIKIIIMLLN